MNTETKQFPEQGGGSGSSWTHRLARPLVRPLVGTAITPNHLTTLRVLTGLAACTAFASGDRTWQIWGGIIWVLSAFLDRVDGEFARLSGQTSPQGHLYDYWSDVSIHSLFFISNGIGLRDSPLGWWAIPIGLIATIGVAAASILDEVLSEREGLGNSAFPSVGGFDSDDVYYLFAGVIWLGWQLPFVIGAAIGGTMVAIWVWWRIQQIPRQAS